MTGLPPRKPVRLYKYIKAEHLELALTRGVFRIGTLFEFRNMEKFGTQIGDVGEGTKSIHLNASQPMTFNLLSDDPRAVHARKVFKGWDEFPACVTLLITMQEKSTLALNEESADVSTYGVTTKYDAAQMHAMGYDACLMIADPQGFFVELSNSLPGSLFIIGAEVQYRDRRVD